MKLTSQKFVDVLLKSSLDADEQKAILKMLPQLNKAQIVQIYSILISDVSRLDKILADFDSDVQREFLKAHIG